MANAHANDAPSREENIEKVAGLIRGIKVAMLTSIDQDGSLHARPMAAQQSDFDGQLWFFTGAHAPKVDEVQHDGHVSVTFSEPSDDRYLALRGRCRPVTDREKMKELWNPSLQAWFPRGLEDPELGLLCVDVERAEYWDTPSRKMVQLLGLAKAKLTGQPSKGEGSRHDTLDIAG